MKKTIINPWKWQDQLGYAQAVEVAHGSHTLYCAGQAAMNADGQPVDADMAGQISLCFDNLEKVLAQAGYSLDHVVRLNFYTTSIEQFFAAYGEVIGRMQAAGCIASSTLTEVQALAFPQLKIEIEATAVRAITDKEVIEWLSDLKYGAPVEIFDRIYQIAKEELPAERLGKVREALMLA